MQQLLRIVFGLNMVFLAMLGFAFLGVDPGSRSYVVAVVTLGVVLLTLLFTGTLIYVGWDGFDPDPLKRD